MGHDRGAPSTHRSAGPRKNRLTRGARPRTIPALPTTYLNTFSIRSPNTWHAPLAIQPQAAPSFRAENRAKLGEVRVVNPPMTFS